jgi:hypothetical protein
MITDILSSAAAAVVDRNRCVGDTDESGRMAQPPAAAAALDMRLLFPNLPLGGGGLPERTDIETDTDNEGEEDGETDHEKGERDEGTVSMTAYSMFVVIKTVRRIERKCIVY